MQCLFFPFFSGLHCDAVWTSSRGHIYYGLQLSNVCITSLWHCSKQLWQQTSLWIAHYFALPFCFPTRYTFLSQLSGKITGALLFMLTKEIRLFKDVESSGKINEWIMTTDLFFLLSNFWVTWICLPWIGFRLEEYIDII